MTGAEKVAIVGAAGAMESRPPLNSTAAERLIGWWAGIAASLTDSSPGEPKSSRRILVSPPNWIALSEAPISVIYAVGVPYPQFRLHPVYMRNTVEAATRLGIKRMLVISSVYSYGPPQTERVAENHPRKPKARKGLLRKEQEDIALAADKPGGLRTLVLRLPDFYGPHAELSLADQVFRGALKGKAAVWLGSPDRPHEFVFVPDVGPVLADLLASESSFGQAWNFGGPGIITGRDFIELVYGSAGRKPKFRTVGPWMLRIGGLFNPLLRELVEMQYLAETPVILDDSKLQLHLGTLRKTPYSDGIRIALDWYRAR